MTPKKAGSGGEGKRRTPILGAEGDEPWRRQPPGLEKPQMRRRPSIIGAKGDNYQRKRRRYKIQAPLILRATTSHAKLYPYCEFSSARRGVFGYD